MQLNGSGTKHFPKQSGVKQGFALALAKLFGIFFSLVLTFAFRESDDKVYIYSRSDGKLFNLARLRVKTNVRQVLIQELLFTDDAALASHTEAGLYRLNNCNSFAHACQEIPNISIGDNTLQVAEAFTYVLS